MKKLFVLLLLGVMVYSPLKAQVTTFKFELGAIYGLPNDDAFVGGIGFYLHPSYYIGDRFNVGAKAEWAVLGGAGAEGLNISISAIGSYLATVNYYFATSKVRPYAGVGLGLYSMGTTSVSDGLGNSLDVEFGNKFGAAPKVGLDLGHFTLNVAYNMIFGINSNLASKDYLSLGVGVFFGGGVKGKGSKKNKIISIDDDEDF